MTCTQSNQSIVDVFDWNIIKLTMKNVELENGEMNTFWKACVCVSRVDRQYKHPNPKKSIDEIEGLLVLVIQMINSFFPFIQSLIFCSEF